MQICIKTRWHQDKVHRGPRTGADGHASPQSEFVRYIEALDVAERAETGRQLDVLGLRVVI